MRKHATFLAPALCAVLAVCLHAAATPVGGGEASTENAAAFERNFVQALAGVLGGLPDNCITVMPTAEPVRADDGLTQFAFEVSINNEAYHSLTVALTALLEGELPWFAQDEAAPFRIAVASFDQPASAIRATKTGKVEPGLLERKEFLIPGRFAAELGQILDFTAAVRVSLLDEGNMPVETVYSPLPLVPFQRNAAALSIAPVFMKEGAETNEPPAGAGSFRGGFTAQIPQEAWERTVSIRYETTKTINSSLSF